MTDLVYRLLSVLDLSEDDSDDDRYFNMGIFRTLAGAHRAASAYVAEGMTPDEIQADPDLQNPAWVAQESHGKPVLYDWRPSGGANYIVRIVVDELQD